MKHYSAHSHTEFFETDDLKEAKDIAMSMCEHFGSAYVIDNTNNQVVDEY